MTRGLSAVFPEAVSVRFRGKPCFGTSTGENIPLYYVKTYLISEIPGVEAVEGAFGTKQFHSKALAFFDSGDTEPNNKVNLDGIAQQLAKDYYNWLKVSFDESYNQIIAPRLDALTDHIEFTYRTDHILSRRYSSPYNGDPEEMFQHDPVQCLDENDLPISNVPCITFYGPPAKCVSNKVVLTRYKVCLIGGDLIQTYISQDTVT